MNSQLLIYIILISIFLIFIGYSAYKLYINQLTINVDYTLFRNMEIYYINLDRSEDRKKNIEKICYDHDINPIRFPAIDGKLLDLNDKKYEKALQNIKWWFVIENYKNVGHFGCYLSHMSIYHQFLKSTKEYCFILEDDAEFITPYLKREIVHNMNNLPKNWDILLLGYEIDDSHSLVQKGNQKTRLKNGLLNINYFTGLHGYIINRNCAHKLIDNLQEMEWILDWNISYLAERNIVNIYGVYPPLICQPAVHMIQINDINYQYQCSSNFTTLTNL